MNDLTFNSKGWNDYLYWQTQDRIPGCVNKMCSIGEVPAVTVPIGQSTIKDKE